MLDEIKLDAAPIHLSNGVSVIAPTIAPECEKKTRTKGLQKALAPRCQPATKQSIWHD